MIAYTEYTTLERRVSQPLKVIRGSVVRSETESIFEALLRATYISESGKSYVFILEKLV